MAVPAHDQRDYEFAKKFGLDIIQVLEGDNISREAWTEDGLHINSGFMDGMNKEDAISAMIKWLEEKGIGSAKVNYRLREWIFARQRYWGEPIPIIHLEDGNMISLPLEDLPLVLPVLDDYKPSKSGASPLDKATDWVNVEITTNVSGNVMTVTTNIEQVVRVTTNAVDTALGAATPTGGKFKLRLPIHRDRGGTTRLLQRVVLAGDVAADGTYDYKLYAGTASPPDTSKTLMRISAVCLPTETPVVEASQENLWNYVYAHPDNTAKFEFTVGAYGATSLLRHPYHPQHDGLRWDFVTHAPDGDDVYNYKGDVKPETFSVKNEIKLEITLGDGVEPWNPEESFNGTCEWTLSGLRHDGKIVLSGPMVLRRISPVVQLMLK